jgi:hypothetical protein
MIIVLESGCKLLQDRVKEHWMTRHPRLEGYYARAEKPEADNVRQVFEYVQQTRLIEAAQIDEYVR